MPFQSLAIHHLVAMIPQESHRAPATPFTVDQAHRIMRFHVTCRARRCRRKAAALHTLVAAGRVVSAPTKPH